MRDSQAVALPRPENKGLSNQQNGNLKPWELDPELAQIKIAEKMMDRFPRPSILTKEFVVRYGMFKAINHIDPVLNYGPDGKLVGIIPGNPTGYDCSLRMRVYDNVSAESVNVEGQLFHNFWAYMNKPKMIINGLPFGQPEEEKQSIFGKILGWATGKGKKNEQNQQNGG